MSRLLDTRPACQRGTRSCLGIVRGRRVFRVRQKIFLHTQLQNAFGFCPGTPDRLRKESPRHQLTAGRGRSRRRYGTRHPCRHPPIASASVMRVAAINDQTERKRQARPVRRAEKHLHQSRTVPLRCLIRPVFAACAPASAAQGEKACSAVRFRQFLRQTAHQLGNVR